MTNENLIHVKLEAEEELEGKKDILTLQADLLQLRKIINKYNSLRQEELKLKLKLHQKIKTLLTNMNKLQTSLPKIKIQDLPHHEEKNLPDSIKLREKIKSQKNQTGLDKELAEIQERLRELSG